MKPPLPPLPPGQRERADFPRFGMTAFADRAPADLAQVSVRCTGAVSTPWVLDAAALATLPRVEQVSDFHCVTSWSRRAQRWSGWRFAEVYRELIVPQAGASAEVGWLVFRSQDGYRADLPLEDLLAGDVLLADRLNDEPLGLAHGGGLRLVAPAHYGYKNVKHLGRIELLSSREGYRALGPAFMSHDRARVALEERGRFVPNWLLRHLFRPLIAPTVAAFERASRRRDGG